MANERKRKDLFEQWVESGEVETNLAIIQSLSMQGKSMKEIVPEYKSRHSKYEKLDN